MRVLLVGAGSMLPRPAEVKRSDLAVVDSASRVQLKRRLVVAAQDEIRDAGHAIVVAGRPRRRRPPFRHVAVIASGEDA